MEGTRIREKAPKEGVSGRWWLRTGGRGPRAGRVPRDGEEGARRSRPAASGRAASDRGVGEGGRRGLRIADTHLPGEERKTTKHTGRYPCGSRARLVLAGDAVGTGKGCWQEVRRGARVRFGAHAPERARRRGRQFDHGTYEETEQRLNAMGMARAGRGHVREQGGIVPRFTRCGQWRGRGEERACDERLGH